MTSPFLGKIHAPRVLSCWTCVLTDPSGVSVFGYPLWKLVKKKSNSFPKTKLLFNISSKNIKQRGKGFQSSSRLVACHSNLGLSTLWRELWKGQQLLTPSPSLHGVCFCLLFEQFQPLPAAPAASQFWQDKLYFVPSVFPERCFN